MNFSLNVGYWDRYALMFFVSYAITFILVPIVIKLAPVMGMVDLPDPRRVHKIPTPRGGGLAVFCAFHLSYLIFYISFGEFTQRLNLSWWLPFLAASSVLVVVGLIDDSKGMHPLVKLAGQAVAGLIMILFGGAHFVWPFSSDLPFWADFALTLFWFLALVNAFNLIDGLDGLCSGLALIGTIGVGLSYVLLRQSQDFLPALALAAGCLGFLRYNFHPAKIFLGDTGSMFLGFSIAAFSLQAGGKGTVALSLGVALLSAGIPLFDTALAIWRRSMRKIAAGKAAGNVMGADKDHLHHRLLDSGLSQRQVALTLYLSSALLVTAGLVSMYWREQSVAVYLISLMIIVYVVVRHVAHIEFWDTRQVLLRNLRASQPRHFATIGYLVWDLLALAVAQGIALKLVALPEIESSIGSKEEWIRTAPLWIFPVFVSLVITSCYTRVWSRGGVRDFFTLQLAIVVGSLVVLAIQIFKYGTLDEALLARWVIFGAAGYFLILTSRSFSQLLQVLSYDSAEKVAARKGKKEWKVLVYGASRRGMLFLRQHELAVSHRDVAVKIVGLIDDDINLRKRFVKGHKVFGGVEELEEVLKQFPRVDAIVVVCQISEANLTRLLEIAKAHSKEVVEWNAAEKVLLLPAPAETPAPVAG